MKSQLNILIVEDDSDYIFLTEDFLKDIGLNFKLKAFKSYEEAEEFCLSETIDKDFLLHDIDFAILDYHLGGKTGLELMPFFQDKGIPTIFLSNNTNTDDVLEVIRAGADDFIIKTSKSYKTALSSAISKTLQKREDIEQQAEREKNLESFARTVAHDLKAPLRSISNFSHLLQRTAAGKLDERSTEWLSYIKTSSGQLANLIGDILESSKNSHKKEVIDLAQMVPDTVDLLSSNKEVECCIETSLPQVVFNKASLFQIFQNLISNSIKYRQGDKALIKIGARQFDDRRTQITIEDNGIGIAENKLKEVFKPFNEGVKRGESHGLGLSIVKDLIEKNNGFLELKSEQGIGTKISFTLELHAEEALI